MGKSSTKRGSVAYWHRSRAHRMTPRVRGWINHQKGLEGLVGYKAGMTSVQYVDDSDSPTKGQEIVEAATIIEIPKHFVYSITLLGHNSTGLVVLTEVNATNAPKFASKASQVRVKLITAPESTGLGKKTPEIIEVPVGGADVKAKLEYAKSILGKELSVTDILTEGEFVDAIAVTHGKGWQGVVKRYGVALNTHKSSKAVRHGGSIGPERQGKVMFTIPRAGQMGFHRRTDKAKRVMMISSDVSAINPVDGFVHYGMVKASYILVQGSVPGPRKRAIILRKTVKKIQPRKPQIKEINKDSKQG